MDHETGRTPVAFLSYSGQDRALAERLAKNLLSQGIQVWYDNWEIQPGDSIRRRIDAGIDQATHFLVLLTVNSLRSEWVQTELDAGMVRRIQGACRLIPLLAGIDDAAVPTTLRGLRWIRLDDYGGGLRDVVNACHEVSLKPPLGSVPARVGQSLENKSLPVSPLAARLAHLLAERSRVGVPVDSMCSTEDILEALQITGDELSVAADELDDLGWVRKSNERPVGPAGFRRIGPEPALLFAVDPFVHGWVPETDARALAAALVNTATPHPLLADVAKGLAWDPRRVNPAVLFLVERGYVEPIPEMGSYPFAYNRVGITPKTRRFANTAQ